MKKRPVMYLSLFGVAAIALAGANLPRWGSAFAHRLPGALFAVSTAEPLVALTIDDGPSAETAEILDVLQANHANATFFFIGEHVRRHAAVAQRVVAAGHEIAHHMMQDEPSIRLSPARFQAQFDSTRVLLEQLGGAPYFRPGSGWYNQRMRETVEASGYRVVLGSVYPFDAQLASPAFSSWYIRHNVSPGAIIILHEANGRGPRTAEVLRAVLPELKRQGLRVVTVSELLRQN